MEIGEDESVSLGTFGAAGGSDDEESLGVDDREPRESLLRRLRVHLPPRAAVRRIAPVASIAASLAVILAIDVAYWNDHKLLAPRMAGYSLLLDDVNDPVVKGGAITYEGALANAGAGKVSLREISVKASGFDVAGIAVRVQRASSFEAVPLTDGVGRLKTPFVDDGLVLQISVRTNPATCRDLPSDIPVGLTVVGADRRKHSQTLYFPRFQVGKADPLLDPALFAGVCDAPRGSAWALPKAASSDVRSAVRTYGGGVDLPGGGRIQEPANGYNVRALVNGNYLIDEYEKVTAYSAQGRELWTAPAQGADVNRAGTRVVTVDPHTVVVRDAVTGARLHTLPMSSGDVSQPVWAGDSVLFNVFEIDEDAYRRSTAETEIDPGGGIDLNEFTTTLVYRWDPGHGIQRPVGDAVPDGFPYVADGRAGDSSQTRGCTPDLAIAAEEGAFNTGGGGVDSVFLAASAQGGKGRMLEEMNVGSQMCPKMRQIRSGTSPVWVGASGGFLRDALEYSTADGFRIGLRVRGLEYIRAIAREDDDHWLASVVVEANPNSYQKPTIGGGSPVTATSIVRCAIKGECQLVRTGPADGDEVAG